MHILGFQPPFEDIKFGPFTGNATLMRYTNLLEESEVLNNHFICGNACSSVHFFLPGGSDRSTTISECEAAPTFCTNHMENTRQLEKQVSPSAVALNCVSAHTEVKQNR